MRKLACITLSSEPGGTMPGGGVSGLSLIAHQHRHLGAERLAVELDRLFAAAFEEQVRLDLHQNSFQRCDSFALEIPFASGCSTRPTLASTLQGPAPAAARYRNTKQNITASSPWFRIGQNPCGACAMK